MYPLARRSPHAARRGLPGRRADADGLVVRRLRAAARRPGTPRRTSRWCRSSSLVESPRPEAVSSSSSTIEHLHARPVSILGDDGDDVAVKGVQAGRPGRAEHVPGLGAALGRAEGGGPEVNLTGFSMRNPFAVIALVLVVVALGVVRLLQDAHGPVPADRAAPGGGHHRLAGGRRRRRRRQDHPGRREGAQHPRRADEGHQHQPRRGLLRQRRVRLRKPIGEAVLDVQNAIGRIRAELPEGHPGAAHLPDHRRHPAAADAGPVAQAGQHQDALARSACWPRTRSRTRS